MPAINKEHSATSPAAMPYRAGRRQFQPAYHINLYFSFGNRYFGHIFVDGTAPVDGARRHYIDAPCSIDE